ncbi:hypothetical protein VM1G_10917 [Cytospora mali]|uniref:PD-(D/E)XK nuclease-like domain-containing protein n=1 Tax=Cytospora mali TaxID=578113 RepID=A0A194VJR4_CYTMA|nr:hypothetical protein VM1G_10917 [Valsa mali]
MASTPPGTERTGLNWRSISLSSSSLGRGGGGGIDTGGLLAHRPLPTTTPQKTSMKRRRSYDDEDEYNDRHSFEGGDREGDRDGDNQQAPRQPRYRHRHTHPLDHPDNDASVTSSSRSGISSRSGRSGTSSPRKKKVQMGAAPEPIDFRGISLESLPKDDMPTELRELLWELSEVQGGEPVISRELKAAIEEEYTQRCIRLLPDRVYADPATRDALGPSPHPRDMFAVHQDARRCYDSMQDEAGWNAAVHWPLLRLAVAGRREYIPGLVDFVQCTTAGILPEYRSPSHAARRVDFVLVLDPENDSDGDNDGGAHTQGIAQCIERLRTHQPGHSINHTDFPPLIRTPRLPRL